MRRGPRIQTNHRWRAYSNDARPSWPWPSCVTNIHADNSLLTSYMPVEKDMVAMFEDAYKQQPNNEELGAQTFFANVRATNWKAAQQASSCSSTWMRIIECFQKQIATRMHKQFQDSRYLYWTVMCTILQVCLVCDNFYSIISQ